MANTGGSNGVGVTIEPHSKNGVIGGVESEVDTENSYRLDSLIPEDDYAKNLPSRNLADVLANLISDLSPTLMDFRSSSAFPVSSSHPTTSDGTSGCKPLDSTSPNGHATCNLGNILAFYHSLFVYFTVKPSTNFVSTDSSHFSSDKI